MDDLETQNDRAFIFQVHPRSANLQLSASLCCDNFCPSKLLIFNLIRASNTKSNSTQHSERMRKARLWFHSRKETTPMLPVKQKFKRLSNFCLCSRAWEVAERLFQLLARAQHCWKGLAPGTKIFTLSSFIPGLCTRFLFCNKSSKVPNNPGKQQRSVASTSATPCQACPDRLFDSFVFHEFQQIRKHLMQRTTWWQHGHLLRSAKPPIISAQFGTCLEDTFSFKANLNAKWSQNDKRLTVRKVSGHHLERMELHFCPKAQRSFFGKVFIDERWRQPGTTTLKTNSRRNRVGPLAQSTPAVGGCWARLRKSCLEKAPPSIS